MYVWSMSGRSHHPLPPLPVNPRPTFLSHGSSSPVDEPFCFKGEEGWSFIFLSLANLSYILFYFPGRSPNVLTSYDFLDPPPFPFVLTQTPGVSDSQEFLWETGLHGTCGPRGAPESGFEERYWLGDNPLLFYCKGAEDVGAVFSDSHEAIWDFASDDLKCL